MLSVDTETTGLDPYEPGFRVFMVQWADSESEHFCTEDTGWQPFLDAVAAEDTLLFANASFDIHALREGGIIDLLATRHRCHDVQTLARVAVPGRFEYALESLGSDLLGKDATAQQRGLREAAAAHKLPWGKETKDYYKLWKLEPELMAAYGKEDARLTWELWELVWGASTPADREVYRMEITGVAPILRAAERDGVLVHQTRLAALRGKLEARRDEVQLNLLAQGVSSAALGSDTEPASSKALLADLLAAGVPLYRKTSKSGELNEKTGKRAPDQLTVSKDALEEFEGRFPVVTDLVAWRSCQQILRTFVPALEKASPRVHTSFRQAEARTGRMSTRNPNLQNLPRPDESAADDDELAIGVRRVIVPAAGNALVVGDYTNIEVYVLAHYIAAPALTAALEAGQDLYAMTAARVYGYAYEDCVKGGRYAAERQRSKTTSLTAMYGGGAPLLARRLGVSVEEAAAIKRATLSAIPGYYALDERLKDTVRRRQFPHVTTLYGRRLYVPRDYVAMNTLVQGGAAEIMKLGMIAAAPALAKYGCRVIMVVHDELVAEGPAQHADGALSAMLSAMESAYPLKPALRASGGWSADSYADAK